MKRFIIALAVPLVMLSACQEKKVEQVKANDSSVRDSLQRVINQKDDEINDMMSTLNQIMDGFRLINQAEGKMEVLKSGETATDNTEAIRSTIKEITDAMQHNRELINKLRQQVRESSVRGDQIRGTLNNMMMQLNEKDEQLKNLQAELEQKNIHITELDNTITALNTDVSSLKQESESKTQTISSQDKQLNTAWYVFGTKKELQNQNIFTKNKVLSGNFNKNYFTKIDIRVDTEIKLYSKTAKILTLHPASSYSLTRDLNDQYILRINNPQSFWSASKYLVILVK